MERELDQSHTEDTNLAFEQRYWSRRDKKDRTVSGKKRELVLTLQRYKCARCGFRRDLEIHHIVAYCEGGPTEFTNLMVLCHQCHKEWHNYWDIMLTVGEALSGGGDRLRQRLKSFLNTIPKWIDLNLTKTWELTVRENEEARGLTFSQITAFKRNHFLELKSGWFVTQTTFDRGEDDDYFVEDAPKGWEGRLEELLRLGIKSPWYITDSSHGLCDKLGYEDPRRATHGWSYQEVCERREADPDWHPHLLD